MGSAPALGFFFAASCPSTGNTQNPATTNNPVRISFGSSLLSLNGFTDPDLAPKLRRTASREVSPSRENTGHPTVAVRHHMS